VKEEGLEECEKDMWRGQTKVAGKKLRYIRREALRQLFGDTCIDSYQALGKVGAVVEKAARRAESIARSLALQHLRDSLKLRHVEKTWLRISSESKNKAKIFDNPPPRNTMFSSF
jgi:hypothetical protein